MPEIGGYVDAYDKEGQMLHDFPKKNTTEQQMNPGTLVVERFSMYHFAGIVCITQEAHEDHRDLRASVNHYPDWMDTS